MGTPKAQTLQARLGFLDNDLIKPKHDEIMQWADNNMAEILAPQINEMKQKIKEWVPTVDSTISGMKNDLASVAIKMENNKDPYKTDTLKGQIIYLKECIQKTIDYQNEYKERCKNIVLEKTWERPVLSNNKYVIGFIDLAVKIESPRFPHEVLYSNKSYFHVEYSREPIICNRDFFFEIKTNIPSCGELIRQIATYRTYCPGNYFVIAPQNPFVSILHSQGIGFIEYKGED